MFKLHEKAMSGDYARVLNKLSMVQAKKGDMQIEADHNSSLARGILRSRKIVTTEEDENGEKVYDSYVYILWR